MCYWVQTLVANLHLNPILNSKSCGPTFVSRITNYLTAKTRPAMSPWLFFVCFVKSICIIIQGKKWLSSPAGFSLSNIDSDGMFFHGFSIKRENEQNFPRQVNKAGISNFHELNKIHELDIEISYHYVQIFSSFSLLAHQIAREKNTFFRVSSIENSLLCCLSQREFPHSLPI